MVRPMRVANATDLARYSARRWRGFTQPKLDGWRMLGCLQEGTLISRKPTEFPIPTIAHQLMDLRAVLSEPGASHVDGELCHANGRFCLDSALRDANLTDCQYHVFDLVHGSPFSNRHNILQQAFSETDAADRWPHLSLVPATSLHVDVKQEKQDR